MRVKYAEAIIEVVKGDITELSVDAIVNPANSLMVMGGGVAAAIKRKGGRKIEEEALKKAPVPVGKAVVTSGGKLKAKYVIHAPTMKKPAQRTTLEAVAKAVTAALQAASSLKINSIAFPGMGTGVGGLRIYDAVKEMAKQIKRHLKQNSYPKKVVLVAYREEDLEDFIKAVSDVFGT
ncbi:MAG: macro domain-containing protein [Thermoprotei archaeon]|nr:MAG: macro domain-containing protein [Thermoprotei archaeon]RLF00948.1 MAG: macro domain-containing protein [Thermoprotei archaeon]HDI74866.1 macro domain-containing protein [Thermoprotei archaeon]